MTEKRTIRSYGVLVLAVLLVSVVPAAAAAQSEPLTLSDAIAAALKHNPEIQAVRHRADAAGSKIIQARSGLLPQLSVSEKYSRTNSPLWAFGTKLNQENIQATDFIPDRLNHPDAIDNYNTSLALSWSLFDGGQTWIGWRQAKMGRQVVDLALLRSEQQVIANAAKAYVGMMLAAENSDVITKALDTARAHLKVVEDRFRGGLAVKSDVLRAQVRIADLEQQHFQAQSQILVAQAMLKAVMGRYDESELKLVAPFEQCQVTQGDLSHWVGEALNRRPDLKGLQIQEEIAGKEIERARAGHWPTLAVQGSYDLNSEDYSDTADSYTVGAMVQLNLYSGQRISAQAAEAKAMLAKVKSVRQGMILGIQVETQKAFYQAQSTWKSISVARGAVAQAEEALRITGNRYKSGLLTLVSLLDAQVTYQQASTQLFKALHDYKVARIELALASGVIDNNFK
ncbi:MAG: TolC family protein [Desulfosarcinaceae bacterium]